LIRNWDKVPVIRNCRYNGAVAQLGGSPTNKEDESAAGARCERPGSERSEDSASFLKFALVMSVKQ